MASTGNLQARRIRTITHVLCGPCEYLFGAIRATLGRFYGRENTTKGQPAVSKREATNPSGQDRHLEACNDAICSQLPIRPGLASRSESAGADERGNSPTEGQRTTIVTRISGGAQETYSHHPKSRIPRNSCEIRNMNFPTRNTLPCFASQSMGGSFSPLCVPASSPSSLRFSPGRRGG